MASDLLMTRLYNNADRKTPYFSRISTSLNKLSINSLHLRFPGVDPAVAGSCNGLLCLEYPDGRYVLWNPSIDEYKLLPPLDLKLPPCSHKNKNGECIVSVQSDVCGLGLGFDNTRKDDYKFVCFIHVFYDDDDDDRTFFHDVLQKVVVYSLKTNCWNEITHPGEYRISSGSATYFDGFCYWKGRDCIVSFDVANEKFSVLPYPEIVIAKGGMLGEHDLLLIEFDGLLGVVIYPMMGAVKLFNFWVMEDGGASASLSWTRKIKFDVRLVGAHTPLGFCRNGASFLFQGIDGKLLEYDYIARKLNKIYEVYDYPLAMKVFPYVESTVTLETESRTHHIETDTLESKRKTKRRRETEQVMEMKTKRLAHVTSL